MTSVLPGSHRRPRPLALVVAACVVVGSAACTGGADSTPSPSSSSPSSTPTPTPTPTPSPSALPAERVVAVKIENTPAAHPRAGHTAADVIYVEPVEAGLTRLLAIFIGDLPKEVGPVRSARETDVDLLANYGKGVPFAFSGASSFTNRVLARGSQKNLPHGSVPGYWRVRGRSAPHNLMVDLHRIAKAAGKDVIAQDVGVHFGEALAGGTAATKAVASWPSAKITATYDAGAGGYRLVLDGRKEIDALTGKPIAPPTIIVQHVISKPSGNRDFLGNVTPIETLTGKGKATFLRDGEVWTGTWSRATAASPTRFAVGTQEFLAAPGQVWVFLLPTTRQLTVG